MKNQNKIEKRKYLNWLAITFGLLFGIIIGMLIMHFIYVYSFERLLIASNGIIENVNIDINETEAVDRIMNWTFSYWNNQNLTIEAKEFLNSNKEWIVIFEQGCMGKPVCLLDKEAVERLIKEWKLKGDKQ